MVHFVGAGPGAPDLITLRGARLLEQADLIIYAGSLVNPALLNNRKTGCVVMNSATMSLEQVVEAISGAEEKGLDTVRLHTGDSSIYGAVKEQMDFLDRLGIAYDVTPGVSSFCGAAAALKAEYTLPGISQTVIITREEGRTPVPQGEKLSLLAAHHSTMVLFLSVGLARRVQADLLEGGYAPDTPVAVVYKATWPEERIYPCTVGTLARTVEENHITKTALMVVGDFLGQRYDRSRLYDPTFTHEFREGIP